MLGIVYAVQDLSSLYEPGAKLGGSGATIGKLLSPILFNVLVISGVFALFTIFMAGFNYITGGGDKNKTAQALNMLNYAIIGLVLVVSAFLITRIMGAVLGFDFLKP